MKSSFALAATAFNSFKAHLGLYLLVLAIPTALTFFVTYYEDFGEDSTAYTISSVLLVVSVLVSILMTSAIVFINDNPSMSVTESYAKASKYFLKSLVLSIGLFILIVLGLILFIIPGIYILVLYSFPYYFLLLEQKSVSESLASSKALVKGRWWSVAWKILFMCFLCVLAFIVIEVISNLVSIPFNENFQYAFSTALSNIIWPFSSLFAYELYKDLKNNPLAETQEAPQAQVI